MSLYPFRGASPCYYLLCNSFLFEFGQEFAVCPCWLPACLTFCVKMDCFCELKMESSEATQLSKVPLALQGSLPWEPAKQFSEQAKICSPKILCCRSATHLVYFSY